MRLIARLDAALASAVVVRLYLAPHRFSWDPTLLKEGIPFLFLSSMRLLRQNADSLLIGLLVDYQAVGYYQLAFKLVNAVSFIPAAIGSAFFPQLAADGLNQTNRRTLISVAKLLLALGLAGTALTLLVINPFTRILYGPLGPQVAPLLRLLALIFPILFLDRFLASTLEALGGEGRVLAATIVALLVSLAANALLILHWGVAGAAWAYLIATASRLAILMGTTQRRLQRNTATAQRQFYP